MSHAPSSPPLSLDEQFYMPADAFFSRHADTALTFDDISLATRYSSILPRNTNLSTHLSDRLKLSIPILSSDMDTVTEAPMAIAMALNGGMGLIHFNMPKERQIKMVSRVKHHIHGLIQDPITVTPDLLIGDVLDLIERKNFNFRTFPVVDENRVLLGLLSGKVVKERYRNRTVTEAMATREELFTLRQKEIGNNPVKAADKFFTEHIGIHKLLVVDDKNRLCGLVTLSDIEKIASEAKALRKPARDDNFRLVVGAAVSPLRKDDGSLDRDQIVQHINELAAEEVDAIAVSTAHGHTEGVGEMVRLVRENFPDLTIIAGNVTSGEGVSYLADCGANAIKVGQGSGSICTTRIVAGVGIPQLTACYVAAKEAAKKGVRIISDGGASKSGDLVKALTLSDAVMCGSLLAGCKEAPGEIIEIGGKLYKQYRGMGSHAAMVKGSASRYGHEAKDQNRKAAAEGIEALKEVSGSLAGMLNELIGGIQSGMGYLGAPDLQTLRKNARYIRVSPAGQKEASPHDVVEISAKTAQT
ncbi:MAG: IMP dehydrogenase [Opitutales bacterium]|nr:IMP dehydrogenase [Opitutales bacterium]